MRGNEEMQHGPHTEAVDSGVAKKLANEFVESMMDWISDRSREIYQKQIPIIELHIRNVYMRIMDVKILCNKDKNVNFEKIYVNTNYVMGNKKISDITVIQRIIKNERIIVSAVGGAGKTFLLRYIWLRLFQNKIGRFPVFLELRKLNEYKSINLYRAIQNEVTNSDINPLF